ncbi:virulence factor Mce family protein [Mycolicibacterium rhodesiae JS60]|nr:virulence factor Mce family protein [Mycolicibacterium rhodesiae JS60]
MDQLTKTVETQIVVFTVVALAALIAVGIGYIGLPSMLFGVGRYTVKLELSSSGNLYPTANVSYRGTEVGRVESVSLTPTGVEATLSLNSGIKIPSNLDAAVHSQTAIGEQYVALTPRDSSSAPLRNGDVIPVSRTTVPPNLNSLLDATNKGLQAIPNDSLKTLVDESYTALGGLGPEFSRFVTAATTLASGAKKNLDDINTLIDSSAPVLDSQTDTADAIDAWTSHLATITGELRTRDGAVAGLLHNGPAAADAVRQLFDRLKPTLPILMANLATVGDVAVVYQNDIEQLLVLLPQGVANLQGSLVPNLNTPYGYKGSFLSFNTLNQNLPPPCLTGFLPAQQRRTPVEVDTPDRPTDDLYCRRPMDSRWNVRGARNIPCETRPGKRAATVKMCESDEPYVPLNDGMNWKGDPNATLSGGDLPAPQPGSPPAAPTPPLVPALAAAEYDPATGAYVAPDGNTYYQVDLAKGADKPSLQSMLMPAGN